MILVTGAGGKTGRAVIRALVARDEIVRALVRSQEQALAVRQFATEEIVVGDLLDAAGMVRAMQGIGAVYLIAPNMHAEESRIGEIAVRAALSAGVERVVYHSVLHPQTREMPHHWQKLVVEEVLLGSGLDFTILQPAAYMQNVLSYWDTVVLEGVYRVAYGEGAALSMVDLEDVAEVAAKVLSGTGHRDATYELAGPEALSPGEVAGVLSASLGRPVAAEVMPVSEWVERARAAGLENYSVDALAKMFRYYDRFGLRGNAGVLEWLLGRQATTLEEFIERYARRLRRGGQG